MKILLIGSGGREHALAWRLAQSPRVAHVYVAPGNPGTANEARCENIAIAADDLDGLLAFATSRGIDLTVVGPEAPLVAGIVDRFQAAHQPIFGPTAAAAQLEGSKGFAKDFMARHGIPTASYARFDKLEAALAHLRQVGAPIVIKADGLAAGKGVVVAATLAEAEQALQSMLGERAFGDASASVVMESFLEGEEASYIVIASGEHYVALASSQDHKRRDDGDQGPNTGGMGAYSPAPVVTREVERRIATEIVAPTLTGMQRDGVPFSGFLYCGVMIDRQGSPRLLEYNVRMGDPETQPLMMRLDDDLATVLAEAAAGRIASTLKFDPRPALAVVIAACGYPENPRRGDHISGLDALPTGVKAFHAGTARDNEGLTTSGGRILCVTALGDDLAAAARRSYEGVRAVKIADAFYRSDIGARALR